jgi:hypothetical protein
VNEIKKELRVSRITPDHLRACVFRANGSAKTQRGKKKEEGKKGQVRDDDEIIKRIIRDNI